MLMACFTFSLSLTVSPQRHDAGSKRLLLRFSFTHSLCLIYETFTSDMVTSALFFTAGRVNSGVVTGTSLTPSVCPASSAKVTGRWSSSSLIDIFLSALQGNEHHPNNFSLTPSPPSKTAMP
ncbi:hypothetical protein SRHO_G00024930 [Serrasalmus rhombeus]